MWHVHRPCMVGPFWIDIRSNSVLLFSLVKVVTETCLQVTKLKDVIIHLCRISYFSVIICITIAHVTIINFIAWYIERMRVATILRGLKTVYR